jgi:hypothetical protein
MDEIKGATMRKAETEIGAREEGREKRRWHEEESR